MKCCTGTHQAAVGCLVAPAATACRLLIWKMSRSPSDRWSRGPVLTNILILITFREWASLEGDYQEWPVGSWVQFRCISTIFYICMVYEKKFCKEQQIKTNIFLPIKTNIFLPESETGQLVVRFRYLVGVCWTIKAPLHSSYAFCKFALVGWNYFCYSYFLTNTLFQDKYGY